MTIRIRREILKARSKGVPDKAGMLVIGPPELFTDDLTSRLALAGFHKSRSKFERHNEVWRLRAGLGPTPDHLLRSLSSIAHVEGDAAVEAAVTMGTASREGGGAGASALTVSMLGPYFCANCDSDNKARRSLLEGAGWFPLFADKPTEAQSAIVRAYGDCPYVTQDGVLAINLQPWMTPTARTELLGRLTEEKRRIARSGAKGRISGDAPVPMPEGEALQGFQDAGVNNLLRTRRSGVIYDDMGLGKMAPLDSKLLTPSGWVLMGDISVGDQVMGSDGRPTTVIGVYPQGEKEIFRVTFSDGASTECGMEHLWAVRRGETDDWRVLDLSRIVNSLQDEEGNNNHNIPMMRAAEFERADLPVDPYVMGVILGSGHVSRGKVHVTDKGLGMLNLSPAAMVDGSPVRWGDENDHGSITGRPETLQYLRRALGAFSPDDAGRTDERIIEDYFLGSVEQRASLLQGLLDSAGHLSGGGQARFSSKSGALADAVAGIMMSLGGNAFRSVDAKTVGGDLYVVKLSPPQDIAPFRNSSEADIYCYHPEFRPNRAIVKVESVGIKPAQCIAVDAPDHLYVTDDYIVTHNTVQGIAYSNARPELSRILVVSKANMKMGWKTSFERFGDRPHNPFIIEGASTVIRDAKTGEETPATPRQEVLVPNNLSGPLPEGSVDLVIINYDILLHHEKFIRETTWDLVILDEVHSVSNEEAIRTRVLFGDLKDRFRRPERVRLSKGGVIIGLSGTPHPVVERMWPVLSSLRPDLFGTGPRAKRIFINRYAPPTLFRRGGVGKIMSIPGRPMREAELNRRLRGSGFMTRRLKADMADLLPPKSRAAIELPFTLTPDEVRELSILDGEIEKVADGVGLRTALSGMTGTMTREGRAEAIIDVVRGLHPKSPEFHEISRLRSRIGQIKAPYVAQYIIEESEGEDDLPAETRPKTVIFAHHKAVISVIKAELDRAYPGQTIVYDGSVTSDKKRFDLERRFQTDDRIRFFLMSLSGASGITLTRANRLYMAEMDWDPTNLPQIEDRIWRMTQEQPCFIGYFMIPNSLDVQMGNRLIQRMQDNRLIYDRVDIKSVNKSVKSSRARSLTSDDAQGELF